MLLNKEQYTKRLNNNNKKEDHMKKRVLFVLLFLLVSGLQINAAQTSYSSAKEGIDKHKRFLNNFNEKNSRFEGILDLYKEYIYQEWDNDGWVNLIKEIATVDTSGEVWTWSIEEMIFYQNNWHKYEKYIVETTSLFSETHRVLSSNGYVWIDEAWVHFSKIAYNYDGALLTEAVIEIAIEVNTFIPFQKYSYEYNEMQMLGSETIYDFTGEWVYSNRKNYDYDDMGRMIELLESNWLSGAWEDTIRTKTVYEDSEFPLEIFEFVYQNGIESPFRRLSYLYSLVPGQITLEQEHRWELNDWSDYLRKSYEYNSVLLLTNVTTEMAVNGSYSFYDRLVFEYNSAFMETEKIEQVYDGSGWVNKNRMLTVYDLTSTDKVETVPAAFELLNNYPNPFNPSTTISYSLPVSSRVQLRVFNSLGEEVRMLVNEDQSAGSYKINFSAADLSSGIYFYNLQAGGISETKKMILIK
jgi:hypothetical protein